MASLHALIQDYYRHHAQLDGLRTVLHEHLAEARAELERATRRAATRQAGRAQRRITVIEAAIERMDRGLYGTCRRCGSLIPLALLRRAPHEQHCARCADLCAARTAA
ncbi:TraR/DksA family transcriptional regulator [Nonomuraea sp. NPDC059194]|uniref:TraR/DksA family transcriptional regulator n=1 Tax=Nonomuraea sp. NPDC059194 TaxID=3346764 RepID=UPI0036B7348F